MLVAAGTHFTLGARRSLKVMSFQRVPPHHVPGALPPAPSASPVAAATSTTDAGMTQFRGLTTTLVRPYIRITYDPWGLHRTAANPWYRGNSDTARELDAAFERQRADCA